MLGEKALSLIRELQRTSDVTPPVFNVRTSGVTNR